MLEYLSTAPLQTWILLAVAVMQGLTVYYSRKTEKNTNSMVAQISAAKQAEGLAAGKLSESREQVEDLTKAVADSKPPSKKGA